MQADRKDARAAMSKALGAAFLSHQVEQLERSVGGRDSNRSTASAARSHHKNNSKKAERGKAARKPEELGEQAGRRSLEADKLDADVVVVDSSVLIHALGVLKTWCRTGRKEEIVIPLEALNTLDLLKKGSTPVAQAARTASRMLEAQVGSNPRIRVQRDDAFVLWEYVLGVKETAHVAENAEGDHKKHVPLAPPPEWLRRTICCAMWEVEDAKVENRAQPDASAPSTIDIASSYNKGSPSPHNLSSSFGSSARKSTEVQPTATSADAPSATKKKVVLAAACAPTLASSLDTTLAHPGRAERADGALIRLWALQAGITLLDIDPAPMGPAPSPCAEKRRASGEKERDRKPSLVEKPAVIEQPVKVLRVLARGEKLDP